MIVLSVSREDRAVRYPNIPRTAPIGTYASGTNQLGPPNKTAEKKYAVLLAGPDSYTLDNVDPEVSVEDMGHIVWQEVQRPNQLPWLVPTDRRLRKLRVSGTIYKNGAPIDNYLRNLGYMTSRPPVITFAYGDYETGQFRITDMSVKTMHRETGTNNVIAATCEFTLTEANDPPSPKPVPSAPAPPPPTPAPAKTEPAKTTYTVKKGDSLWAIATKFYNNGSVWNRIADANGIKDPRRLAVGQVLVIP